MKRIVVLQRGWVVVGDFSQTGDEVTVENASVVRYWGTDRGLGQLAESGPLENTKLDPTPTVRCHQLAVVFTIDCNLANWSA